MPRLDGWRASCIALGLFMAAAIAAPAQTFSTVFTFDGTNGAGPSALIQATDGNFYGTTIGGGAGSSCGDGGGCGTFFKITPEGTLTTLYSFCTQTACADGENPIGALVQGTDGNFYGVTEDINFLPSQTLCSQRCGTVFKITPAGVLTTLHTFDGTDGEELTAGLVQGTDGNFYGATFVGGTQNSKCSGFGCGTLFKITAGGTLTTLHFFDGTDGYEPSGLIQGTDGNFYGTTEGGGTGGSSSCENGCGVGTVFKMTPSGTLTTLHSFNVTDGLLPAVALAQGTDGNFYGSTDGGGSGGSGTLFKITPAGKLTTLYGFFGGLGNNGLSPMVQATDGNFYGAGGYDVNGTDDSGMLFRIAPTGSTLTTLYNFTDGTDGIDSESIFQATNGTLYGVTGGGTPCDGCNSSYGTVFGLDMGLGPFVSFVRASGHVGQTVEILGQGFTGTAHVSFHGTSALFNVKSDSYLTATVPAGATTGLVTVTESSGGLTSNKIFRVTPQILGFSPTSGPDGTTVVITGESFTGATEVVFACGKKATFTVDSDTKITATVPTGAMTGAINLVTPGGNVGSATSFTVTP
jgi:uncharacterized repeat protein (TIGR03803 family)